MTEAERLVEQLQARAYTHGYEDAHPSNAWTRQAKADAASRETKVALLAELRYLQSKVGELRLSLDIAMNLLPPLRRKVVKKIIDDALIAARQGGQK